MGNPSKNKRIHILFKGTWNILQAKSHAMFRNKSQWIRRQKLYQAFFFFFDNIFVQSLSFVWLFLTPWTAAHQVSLFFTISPSLLKLLSIESVMSSSHLILCHPLLLLPSAFPSIRVFSNESALHIRWPKYWSFCSSTSPSNEYSESVAFWIDRFDLLTVQGILKYLQFSSVQSLSCV